MTGPSTRTISLADVSRNQALLRPGGAVPSAQAHLPSSGQGAGLHPRSPRGRLGSGRAPARPKMQASPASSNANANVPGALPSASQSGNLRISISGMSNPTRGHRTSFSARNVNALMQQQQQSQQSSTRKTPASYEMQQQQQPRQSFVNAREPLGGPPRDGVRLAERGNWTALIQRLMQEPHLARQRDHHGMLPLHWACTEDDVSPSVIKVLLRAFPEGVLTRNNAQYLPIHIAVRAMASPETLELLCQARPSSLLEETPSGKTPLMLAIETGLPARSIDILRRAQQAYEELTEDKESVEMERTKREIEVQTQILRESMLLASAASSVSSANMANLNNVRSSSYRSGSVASSEQSSSTASSNRVSGASSIYSNYRPSRGTLISVMKPADWRNTSGSMLSASSDDENDRASEQPNNNLYNQFHAALQRAASQSMSGNPNAPNQEQPEFLDATQHLQQHQQQQHQLQLQHIPTPHDNNPYSVANIRASLLAQNVASTSVLQQQQQQQPQQPRAGLTLDQLRTLEPPSQQSRMQQLQQQLQQPQQLQQQQQQPARVEQLGVPTENHRQHDQEPVRPPPNTHNSGVCSVCYKKFSMFRKKYQCKACWTCLCRKHVAAKIELPGYIKKRSVCADCLIAHQRDNAGRMHHASSNPNGGSAPRSLNPGALPTPNLTLQPEDDHDRDHDRVPARMLRATTAAPPSAPAPLPNVLDLQEFRHVGPQQRRSSETPPADPRRGLTAIRGVQDYHQLANAESVHGSHTSRTASSVASSSATSSVASTPVTTPVATPAATPVGRTTRIVSDITAPSRKSVLSSLSSLSECQTTGTESNSTSGGATGNSHSNSNSGDAPVDPNLGVRLTVLEDENRILETRLMEQEKQYNQTMLLLTQTVTRVAELEMRITGQNSVVNDENDEEETEDQANELDFNNFLSTA